MKLAFQCVEYGRIKLEVFYCLCINYVVYLVLRNSGPHDPNDNHQRKGAQYIQRQPWQQEIWLRVDGSVDEESVGEDENEEEEGQNNDCDGELGQLVEVQEDTQNQSHNVGEACN